MHDAVGAGLVGQRHARGPVQQLGGVEDVVDPFVLPQAARVDPGAGGVELLAHERVIDRDREVDRPHVVGQFRDHLGADAAQVVLQRDVLDHGAFQRRVAGPFAEAEQRPVQRVAAVQPGGGPVGVDAVEIVVAVPFQAVAGHAALAVQLVDHLRHAPRQLDARIVQAEAHRVADPDLDRLVLRHLLAHPHQAIHERQHEPVPVGAGRVFQVAARTNAGLERRIDHFAIRVHALLAALELQLVEDVVVRTAGQHARLLQSGFLDQAEIAFHRADPARAFRIPVAQAPAAIERVAVVLGVQEELGLPDDAVRAAEFGQQVVQMDHLLDAVRRAGLLAVAERGVRDDDVAGPDRGRIEFDDPAVDRFQQRSVEFDLRRQIVVEGFFQQIRGS